MFTQNGIKCITQYSSNTFYQSLANSNEKQIKIQSGY